MSLYHVVGASGRLVAQDEALAEAGLESASIPVPGTEPIGAGRPLAIILRHVYTGRYPKSGTFGARRKDILLTSAVRDVFTTFNAAPRAINIIKQRIPRSTSITGVDATESGTPLIYYAPAVTSVSTTVTFEMSFDDFPDELVSRIGSAMASSGGIPLFGPYGAVMIAVGLAIKLVSKAVNSLADARPEFAVSERLEFELPDGGPVSAGYRVLCEPTFDPTPFSFKLGVGLVDAQERQYTGDEPYVVLLLDGKKQDAFKNFAPTAATAALLERFLQQKEGSEVIIDAVVDAFRLYNDLRFRKEADKLATQLPTDANSDEYKAVKKKMDALLANIGEQLLKPKS